MFTKRGSSLAEEVGSAGATLFRLDFFLSKGITEDDSVYKSSLLE
jgi:hypothetical protein